MKHRLRNFSWIAALMLIAGCASGPPQWGQFHGDALSQGFQPVKSGFALSSAWISATYKITSSSPVLGYDYEGKEILYVGTVDGLLIAVDTTDGTEKWACDLGNGGDYKIVSSPAVSDKRDIYVISNKQGTDDLARSTLHKVDEFSNLRWSFTFPDEVYTLASPKVLTSGEQTLIFVYVFVGGRENLQGELFVLHDDDTGAVLLDREKLGVCRYSNAGGRSGLGGLLEYQQDTWDLVSRFPVESAGGGIALPDAFVAPTPAIDASRPKPLIVIADNLCSMGAYEWDGSELSVVWSETHAFNKHSSTALLSNGLMVFGRRDGKVFAHDALTGVKMWQYDAAEPVLATPAGPSGEYIFVVSKNHLQVLHVADGTLVQDGKLQRKLELLDRTFSSPAVSKNRVHVSSGEMLTVDYDLKKRGHDSNFRGNGLSSVAIGHRGDVYAVGIDGTIRKYGGTN